MRFRLGSYGDLILGGNLKIKVKAHLFRDGSIIKDFASAVRNLTHKLGKTTEEQTVVIVITIIHYYTTYYIRGHSIKLTG